MSNYRAPFLDAHRVSCYLKIERRSKSYRVMEVPKLRQVEALPVEVEGRKMIGLRDPLGISPEVLFLSPEAFFIASLMDGKNSLRDIQAAYMRRFGELIFTERIEDLIRELDAHYLLETPNFLEHLERLKEEFRHSQVRQAAFAGKSYPATKEALQRELAGFFSRVPPQTRGEKLRGLIAPHIDFARGGECYAHAYRALDASGPSSLYVILGTCHTHMKEPFTLTKKAFETPFGRVETDQELVEGIARALPFNPFEDEFLHRQEHTIEFQLIFLQYLWGNSFRILPVLCRSFQEYIQEGKSPIDDPYFRSFIEAVKEALVGKEAVFLASADLAHVGPQFGHLYQATPGLMIEVRNKDMEMISHVLSGDAEGFFRYIWRERDERNICGLPPIYSLLLLIEGCKGQLLEYRGWRDPQGKGAVTFASISLK